MLRTIYIAIAVLAVICTSCNKQSVGLSNRDTEEAHDEKRKELGAEGVTPSPKITVTTLGPKHWPQCWLSFRLSVMTAFHIAGHRDDAPMVAPTYTLAEGRQKFQGESKNPTTSGDCVINWFGQDNPDEPWVELFKQEFPRYAAVISCKASPTPDCLCAATLPVSDKDGFSESEERCVRKTADGNYKLYSVHEVADDQTVPAAGHCTAAHNAVGEITRANLGLESFRQQTQDRQETGYAGQTCRTDIEPFAPQPEEEDWYADKIRDWAVTTCTDESTGCRCYAIYNKSGYIEGERAGMFEHETCLLCKDGTCQLAKM